MTTALITGASRGIGRAVAEALVKEGVHVIAGVRTRGTAPKGAQQEELDMSSPDSIAACAKRLAGAPLDVLVNNAGIYTGGRKEIWAVNVRGPLLLTRALQGQLTRGARVVFVSSQLGALASQDAKLVQRLARAGMPELERLCEEAPGSYGASKAALNRLAQLFAKELKAQRVNAISPGWVKTAMGGSGAPRSLEQGASSVLWGCRTTETGGFFQDGQPQAW